MSEKLPKAIINESKGDWGKINAYWAFSVIGKYYLNASELSILFYIVVKYNKLVSYHKTDCSFPLSYTDIQKQSRLSKNTVKSAIKRLLKYELILCVNQSERKGRASFMYIPNEKKLLKLLQEIPVHEDE